MSDPWDQQNQINEQFFNNLNYRFARNKIASNIKEPKTHDLPSFEQLSITKLELEPIETKEEQINGKQESTVVVPSIGTTSSHSKTYYPDIKRFAHAQSIASNSNNNNNNEQVEVPHFDDPMDSISNNGSVYPSLPIKSHSLHSSNPSDSSSHNRKYRNNLLTPYTHRGRRQHQYHHLQVPSSHQLYRKKKIKETKKTK
eukprot:537188_1